MRSFGIARAYGRVVGLLTSRSLSLWVMGAWIALAAVWLVPFQLTGQPESTVQGIASDWLPFRVVYVALLATTAACALTRLARDFRRASGDVPVDRPLPALPARIVGADPARIVQTLRGMGFEVRALPDRVLAVRRRWMLLGGALFHLAIPLLATGLFIHHSTLGSIHFRLVEGQTTDDVMGTLDPGEGRWEALPSVAGSLTLDSVDPAYFEDVLLFERLDASITDRRTGERRRFTLASPLWLDVFTTLSIKDYGLAPWIRTMGPSGRVEDDIIADLAIFPPGSQDSVTLPKTGYRVSLMCYPDYGVRDGRDVSLSYNLRKPMFRVGVENPGQLSGVVARGLIGVKEPLPVLGGRLEITELRRYGEFTVTRSYGWPVLALSAVLMVAGLAARFLYPREDVLAWEVGAGSGLTARVDGRGGAGVDALLSVIEARATHPGGGPAGPDASLRRRGRSGPQEGFAAPDTDAFDDPGGAS